MCLLRRKTLFIIMEYADGGDLGKVAKTAKKANPPVGCGLSYGGSVRACVNACVLLAC